jgi:hypothetical protein
MVLGTVLSSNNLTEERFNYLMNLLEEVKIKEFPILESFSGYMFRIVLRTLDLTKLTYRSIYPLVLMDLLK